MATSENEPEEEAVTPNETEDTPVQLRPEMGQDDDPLPEWEELSPELMEDECVRGDFMLRWAAILLSVLLGWVFVTESSLLVQIRTGEYLTSHGFLPPATDVFGATTQERSWVNLHWLSDIVLSMLHGAAGFSALSVLSAVTLGATFWFLARITFPKVSTWWASICSVLALMAVFPIVQPGPTTLSLLMLAAIMWVLFAWSEQEDSIVAWCVPVLCLIWANVSEEAIFGVIIAGLGVALTGLQRKRPTAQWGGVLAATLICGILISPWLAGPLSGISFAQFETVETQAYGGLSKFFSNLMYGASTKSFWSLSPFIISAMTLLGVSFISMVLNISRLRWSFAAAWFVANTLSLLFGDWVCYAAIVNFAVAVVNGQDWYRTKYSMEYTIDTWSVFVARAGRAVTVLSFFALAYFAVNGALMGPAGRRIGTGLDPRWENRIESTAEVIDHAYGENIFPLRPDQGDLLIWLGKKPFVDSRVSLYASGDENLMQLHRDARGALFGDGERELWFDTLQQYEITDALARLWGENPAYAPFTQLLVRQDWIMTGLGAAGANFTYVSLGDQAVQEHINEHQVGNFVKSAFREENSDLMVSLLPTFPRPVTDYDRWLIQKLPAISNNVQMARHYDEIRARLSNYISAQQACALAHLTIRYARAELYENANNPLTYQALCRSQLQLASLEQNYAQMGGSQNISPIRPQLAMQAAYKAVQASNDNAQHLLQLFQILLARQKLDVALEVGQQLLPLQIANSNDDSEQTEELQRVLDQLSEHVQKVKDDVEVEKAGDADLSQLVNFAIGNQCPKLAASLLKEDLTKVAADPNLQMVYASILFDIGQASAAIDELEGLAQMMQNEQAPQQMQAMISQWRNITALVNLSTGHNSRAIDLWQDEAQSMAKSTLSALIRNPFSSTVTEAEHSLLPALTARVVATSQIQLPEQWSTLQLQSALAELEAGHNSVATSMLESILKEHPEYSMRGIVVYYLSMLTGENYEIAPPSSFIPVWDGMFAEDEQEPKPKTTQPGPMETEPDSPAAEAKETENEDL